MGGGAEEVRRAAAGRGTGKLGFLGAAGIIGGGATDDAATDGAVPKAVGSATRSTPGAPAAGTGGAGGTDELSLGGAAGRMEPMDGGPLEDLTSVAFGNAEGGGK